MQLHYLVYLSLMACFADINVSQGSVATMQGAVGFLMHI